MLFFFKDEPLFTLGPHWPLFICTFTIFAAAGYALTTFVAAAKSDFWYFSSMIVSGLEIFLYLLTALLNPGILTAKTPYPLGETGIGYCTVCNVRKDNDTYHCYDCEVCIRGYDHHCPWTGKCIGKNNMIPFNLFVSSTTLYIFYCMFACVYNTTPSK